MGLRCRSTLSPTGATLNHSLLYLEHLSEQDLDLLGAVAGEPDREAWRRRVASRPDLLDAVLADPRLFDRVYVDDAAPARTPSGPAAHRLGPELTPFLAFGVLVHRLRADLVTASYVNEWAGPNRRLPVFDVASLREFMDDAAHRYFLVELLASFTKVASGSTWVRTRRGMRRRRYSELDPVRLADMVEQLPPFERPAGYRRLGDVALFLSGVFPDHTALHPLGPLARAQLARSAGLSPAAALTEPEDLAFHEEAGAAWYRRAVDAATVAVGAGPEFLRDVADHFQQARRVLNHLTDRYLHGGSAGLAAPT